jgi:hypothetical protein
MVRVAVLAAAFASGLFAASATASIGIAYGPFARTTLRVDAAGNAEVAWTTAAGVSDSVVVPPTGQLYHGRLSGADVSRPFTGVVLPYRLAVRTTPDGRLWALQAWQTATKGPVELRLSRWKGAPTVVTLARKQKGSYLVLVGRALFHGRPVTGSYTTNGGATIPEAAQLDCFACPDAHGQHWYRFNGVRPQANGTFGSGLKSEWMGARYRVTIVGPNSGTTLAPDAAQILATG